MGPWYHIKGHWDVPSEYYGCTLTVIAVMVANVDIMYYACISSRNRHNGVYVGTQHAGNPVRY